MSIKISDQVINNATDAIETYIREASNLYQELLSTITTLQASGFIGEAADGYRAFFDTKITPALTDNLTIGEASLMGALAKMMEDIGTQFMDNLDPKLGEANRNAGNGEGAAN